MRNPQISSSARLVFAASPVALLALSLGCGSDNGSALLYPGSGGDGAGTGSLGGASGAAGAGPVKRGELGPAGTRLTEEGVTFTDIARFELRQDSSTNPNTWSFWGSFEDVTHNDEIDPMIELEQSEDCVLLKQATALPAASTDRRLNAGELTIAVNDEPHASPEKNGDNSYLATGSSRLFSPQDTVSLTATGAEAPAFLLSTPAPAALRDIVYPTALVTGESFVITWTTEADATGTAGIIWSILASSGILLHCEVPASEGFLEVPGSMTEDVPIDPSGAHPELAMSLLSWQRPTVLTDGFDIVLEVENRPPPGTVTVAVKQ